MHKNDSPLFRLSKRDELTGNKKWIIRIACFLGAIVIGGLLFLLIGRNPFVAYGNLIISPLSKKSAIRQTVKYAVALLGTSLALTPCFRMRFWNCGAEGQITAGAIAASYFALFWSDKLSKPVLLIVMGIAAMIFGGIWALIPGFFKAKWNTNETLFTLMMNYIIIGVVNWLQGGPWEGKPGSQIIPNFKDNAVLPKVFGIHCGWIIVLVLVFLCYIYMRKTKYGYEIAVIGDSESTAYYAGMNVGKIIMRTAFLSGAICGLVGYMVASGANQTLYSSVAAGVGFTAITVAWLAQFNPFAMVIISLFMGILEKGAGTLQTNMGIPTSMSDIIIGIFLFSMLVAEFFINYKIITKSNTKGGAVK